MKTCENCGKEINGVYYASTDDPTIFFCSDFCADEYNEAKDQISQYFDYEEKLRKSKKQCINCASTITGDYYTTVKKTIEGDQIRFFCCPDCIKEWEAKKPEDFYQDAPSEKRTEPQEEFEEKCRFDEDDGCGALVCYSSRKCGAKDEDGNIMYKEIEKVEEDPKIKEQALSAINERVQTD